MLALFTARRAFVPEREVMHVVSCCLRRSIAAESRSGGAFGPVGGAIVSALRQGSIAFIACFETPVGETLTPRKRDSRSEALRSRARPCVTPSCTGQVAVWRQTLSLAVDL